LRPHRIIRNEMNKKTWRKKRHLPGARFTPGCGWGGFASDGEAGLGNRKTLKLGGKRKGGGGVGRSSWGTELGKKNLKEAFLNDSS